MEIIKKNNNNKTMKKINNVTLKIQKLLNKKPIIFLLY